jgi:hypothetical protein
VTGVEKEYACTGVGLVEDLNEKDSRIKIEDVVAKR